MRARGASSVTLRFTDPVQVNQSANAYDGAYATDSDDGAIRYERNVRMLDLRQKVFELSNTVERDYTHYLYIREDARFFDESFSVQDLLCICGQGEGPCYAVDLHCPFTGWSDKLFWLNRAAANIMFVEPVDLMANRNTESAITALMESHGVCATPLDLRRGDVRYVSGSPDVCLSYAECNSGHPNISACPGLH